MKKERVETTLLNKMKKRILVTATMSAGKSTLVNALVGNKIMATRNESCTAKRFTIIEDPNTKNQVIFEYKNIRMKFQKNIATVMHEVKCDDLKLRTRMFHREDSYLWEIIDTPGVNSSADPDHKQVSESLIRSNDFDILLYVMNGNHLGTNDDLMHLRYIKEHVDDDKIIFVINKVDQYRKSQDSIPESYRKTKHHLKELGFANPRIQPISAYAAFLMKQELLNKEFNEEEEEELQLFKRKFKREHYDLSHYQEWSKEVFTSQDQELLKRCGILGLEELIVRKEVEHG
ncbi:dynamin family protein [Domibacillus aminovorans]|uniref:Dynamin N-terminal domain-containing protein n=1 Tax=Domibacillus aminovorans TaxID=29332 RepID=A0A177LAE5_9BACI|nr:dynamin family protein [Domibacillus aminovorans]OAH61611.1 hypothetical protein AWH49_11720 [Domibacillus aminovorans]